MTDPNNIIAFEDIRRILKGVMIEPAPALRQLIVKRVPTEELQAATVAGRMIVIAMGD